MRQVVFSPLVDRLVYLDAKATPEFWDARWREEGPPIASRQDEEIARVTGAHLPPGARILEGGCGRGNKVAVLAKSGFEATGVDFAPASVRQARVAYPGLDIREGDVRVLPFEAAHFDGYWSIGVIEHFWEGYDRILAEARRVLRPGGYLFLTAPWFSPYRRARARRGGYERRDFAAEPPDFYQFALGRPEVAAALNRNGFDVTSWHGLAPEVSMQEDMSSLRKPIHWLLASRGSPFKRVLRRGVCDALRGYCGHSFMVIARRQGRASPDGA